MMKLFISSVQKEFALERKEIAVYIRQDAVLGKFFEPFLFEELPARDVSAAQAYLSEVEDSDVYLGLFGAEYGFEDKEGVSPTEREYDNATENHKYRIILIKDVQQREPKEKALIKKAEHDVVRNKFKSFEQLRNAVYAALVHYLELRGFLQNKPFDATWNEEATLEDLDNDKIRWWTGMAREKRNYPIAYSEENVHKILTSLHLISDDGKVSNAALLLFAKDTQKWFVTAIVKCVQFYGTKMQKPMASQQVYTGSIFEVVDQAVSFVMSHIDARVGERTESAQVDVEHELPMQAVTETIVNSCVHRDYLSNGSVQVMLFNDRLEVRNPGRLPKGITIGMLSGEHTSLPVNPLLAYPVYLAGYIEQVGTGTTDIIDKCLEYGLKKPVFSQGADFSVTIWRKNHEKASNEIGKDGGNDIGNDGGKDIGKDIGNDGGKDALPDKGPNKNVLNLINVIGKQQLTLKQVMGTMSLKSSGSFHKTYLDPAINDGYVTKLYPDKPTSKGQAYLLTERGLKVWKKSRKK